MEPYRLFRVGAELWDRWRSEEYASGGFNSVFVRALPGDPPIRQLDFLRELPGVRGVIARGDIRDDTAVFDVPNLEFLELHTSCRKPLKLERLPQIRHLKVPARSGFEGVAALENLESLEMWRWKGTDLRFLGGKPNLSSLQLECRKQQVDTEGLQGCEALDELRMLDIALNNFEGISELSKLHRLEVIGYSGKGVAEIDLTTLASRLEIEKIILTHQGHVVSLQPLLNMPSLKEVRLRGTVVRDRDLSPLLRLPPSVLALPGDDVPREVAAGYSPPLDDVMRAREQLMPQWKKPKPRVPKWPG